MGPDGSGAGTSDEGPTTLGLAVALDRVWRPDPGKMLETCDSSEGGTFRGEDCEPILF